MAINCPKCVMTPLESKLDAKGVVIDVCPRCGGCWYDLGELRKFVKDPAKFEAIVSRGLIKPAQGTVKCPRCGGPTAKGGLGSEFLLVEMCAKCKGIWLDKSELRILTQTLGI